MGFFSGNLQSTAQKMKFSIVDFFSKWDQIWRKLWILSDLLKKNLTGNVIFWLVQQFYLWGYGHQHQQWSFLNEVKSNNKDWWSWWKCYKLIIKTEAWRQLISTWRIVHSEQFNRLVLCFYCWLWTNIYLLDLNIEQPISQLTFTSSKSTIDIVRVFLLLTLNIFHTFSSVSIVKFE